MPTSFLVKKHGIYVDTSVIGGCYDPEFKKWSNRLLEAFRRGEHIPVLSSVTAAEVEQAPERVKQLYREVVDWAPCFAQKVNSQAGWTRPKKCCGASSIGADGAVD
jgi:hypothetical protein